MRALPLLLLGLLGSANAGGIIDGSPHKLVDCEDMRPQSEGWRPASAAIRIKGLRWVARDGKERRVAVGLDLAAGPPITAPSGEWTDLILELDGPLSMTTRDGAKLSLTVPEILVALDTPAEGGDRVVVVLGLSSDQLLTLADARGVDDDHPLAGALRGALIDGAVACRVE